MSRLIDPVVVSGLIVGQCPRCKGRFEGQFDSEPNVELSCLDCGHVGRYVYHWPDELPRPHLRHRKNKRLLETSFTAPKRQRKKRSKKNPDNILKGQLKFEGAL